MQSGKGSAFCVTYAGPAWASPRARTLFIPGCSDALSGCCFALLRERETVQKEELDVWSAVLRV